MKALPQDAVPYRRTAEFTESTVPAALRSRHSTKSDVWAGIRVLEGSLLYRILEPVVEEHVLTPETSGIVRQTPGSSAEISSRAFCFRHISPRPESTSQIS